MTLKKVIDYINQVFLDEVENCRENFSYGGTISRTIRCLSSLPATSGEEKIGVMAKHLEYELIFFPQRWNKPEKLFPRFPSDTCVQFNTAILKKKNIIH